MKAKRKYRFNIVDFLIIALIVSAVCSVIFRSQIQEFLNVANNRVFVEYTFSIEGVTPYSRSEPSAGEEIFLYKTNGSLGVIKTVNQSRAARNVILEDQSIQKVDVPDMFDLVCTARGKVNRTNAGFMAANGIYITPGEKIEVYTDSASFILTVLSVQEELKK